VKKKLGMLLQMAGVALMPVALVAGLTMERGFLLEIALGATGIMSFLLGRYLENRGNKDRIRKRKEQKLARKRKSDRTP